MSLSLFSRRLHITHVPIRSIQAAHAHTIPFSRKKSNNKSVSYSYSFKREARDALTKIQTALSPMEEMNDKFEIIRHDDELNVDCGEHGFWWFRICYEDEALHMNTPRSGSFSYKFDIASKEWLNEHDRHDIRGLITRDMIRGHKGLPAF
mmetsp:Transcript_24473/g.35986  ORF Transcript_24473/g.35986 Transcript_24473/m.35986 type:complete len:150 (+) Transcript_24473:35-484(+)